MSHYSPGPWGIEVGGEGVGTRGERGTGARMRIRGKGLYIGKEGGAQTSWRKERERRWGGMEECEGVGKLVIMAR